jgi:predicted RNase H-like nuclease (RuvC/YqgF family)
MAFTVSDFSDLTRLLEERPEWRSELRRLLLSDELLTLPQAVRELLEAQRRTEERLEKVEERLEKAEERLSRLEATVQNLAEQVRLLAEQVGAQAEQMRVLAQAQQRTADTVGGLKGRMLELTYRDKATSYFGHLLRRLRVVEPNALEDALEANLTPGEFRDVFRLDLLLSGRPRRKPEEPEVWLAVEISSVVDQDDVDRAERRAKLLKRAGYRTLPVAAGEGATRGAEESARVQKVVLLQDGQASFWDEALEAWAA